MTAGQAREKVPHKRLADKIYVSELELNNIYLSIPKKFLSSQKHFQLEALYVNFQEIDVFNLILFAVII